MDSRVAMTTSLYIFCWFYEFIMLAESDTAATMPTQPDTPITNTTTTTKDVPYTWKQTLQDVDLILPLPAGIRSKDLQVDMTRTELRIGRRGQSESDRWVEVLPFSIQLHVFKCRRRLMTRREPSGNRLKSRTVRG